MGRQGGGKEVEEENQRMRRTQGRTSDNENVSKRLPPLSLSVLIVAKTTTTKTVKTTRMTMIEEETYFSG